MPRYFLQQIEVEGFRGINNEGAPLKLKMSPDTVNSVFAVNGLGKSSLFEALNYAIKGNVPKLAELKSQEKPEKYYGNRFHSQGKATIQLQFVPDDTTGNTIEILVERDAAGQRTVISPSGHPDPEKFLSDLNEEFALLDYNTFSNFITNSPLERGRSFSALLGLSAYSGVRQSLQAVSDTRGFNNDFEVKVIEANISSSEQASQLALSTMRTSYERVVGSPLIDVEKLNEYGEEVFSAMAKIEMLKAPLQGKDLSNIDFEEIKKVIKDAEGGDDRNVLAQTLSCITKLEAPSEPNSEAVQSDQDDLERLIVERDALLESTRGEHFKHLYEAAKELMEEGEWTEDQQCPLCTSTLDGSISDHVKDQLDQYLEVGKKLEEIQSSWENSDLSNRFKLLEGEPLLVEEEAKNSFSVMNSRVESGTLSQADITAVADRMTLLEATRTDQLTKLNTSKDEIEKKLPKSLVQLTEQVEFGRQFAESFETFEGKKKEIEGLVERQSLINRWKEFIDKASGIYADAETRLSKAKIASIDSDYKDMFKQIMNVGDVVPDLKKEEGREDLNVQLLDFHGQQDLSARALLSESYRNALAISVFLSAAMEHTGAPRFIVLDDVTSSFDADHQYFLMELIRTKLQYPNNPKGVQFIILSHDGLLEKYFDKLSGATDWRHHKLQGSPPMGAILSQSQDANRLKTTANDLLDAGQITQAEPLIRQYLEYKLQQIIRKIGITVPIDFAIKDHSRMVSNCLDAISASVKLHDKAGVLVLEQSQVTDLDTVHVPALIGNWVSHYETGSGSSLSAPVLKGVISAIDALSECFRFDDNTGGSIVRRWYKSLSKKS